MMQKPAPGSFKIPAGLSHACSAALPGQLDATAAVQAVLARGGVAVFPEGGIGGGEGAIQALHGGIALFAGLAQVATVTVGIAGTSRLWL
jgi:1-acyl-sn-glycerol-3-phosphate acyltransferase